MVPGDLVTASKYGADVRLLGTSINDGATPRDQVGTLRKDEVALVIDRMGSDVRVLCREGVGWAWHGNLVRVDDHETR